ncbi:MAG: PSD1 domain-containing protein [Planctomycetaceae bacterium]|nr:PSD1 domain-containing protein [Planctomycetaceae bacterium]
MFVTLAVAVAVLLQNASSRSCADDRFFEARIRPLFIAHCFPCHTDAQADGGLSLESREGWVDRNVIATDAPGDSMLLKAVRGELPDLQMPPTDSEQQRLSAAQISDLEQWIRDGAVDPRVRVSSSSGPERRAREFRITDKDLKHWAYQPLASTPPDDRIGRTSAELVDYWVEAKLTANGLQPVPMATPRELVRRAYFDLWGLPPEPEVVEQFTANPSDEAWAALIERLLASRHYGERWGRYWLDWVRFAESNGYERDGPKPHAWRYRDYVIESFHTDKPYDRFLEEQLAGDLQIADSKPTIPQSSVAWRDAIIATGYYRLHVWDDEPDDSLAAEFDELDDVIVTTGAAVMGLTIGCARCHDHKFDPISQTDYYALLDLFRDIDPYGTTIRGGGSRAPGRIESWLCDKVELEKWTKEKDERIAGLELQLQESPEDQRETLQAQIRSLRDQRPPFDQALSIQVRAGERPVTHVLARGDYHSPLQSVSPAYPSVFHELGWLPSSSDAESFGQAPRNRLDFARWLTGPAQPLTARVLANRIWLNHFGRGIVETPDDFGYTGLLPANVELLDYLAQELIDNHWSIKHLHRSIMNSRVYRRSSSQASSVAQANAIKDPDNRWIWRQNLRRLDAEAIRDSFLKHAGVLHPKSGGPSVFTDLPNEIRDTANPISISFWGTSPAEEQNCRSVYLFVKRSLRDPILEAFDFANSHSPVGQRPITTVAPQALALVNDAFVRRQAEHLANRTLNVSPDPRQRARSLWWIVWQREPTESELESALSFLSAESANGSETERWVALARVVLNSNETLFVD